MQYNKTLPTYMPGQFLYKARRNIWRGVSEKLEMLCPGEYGQGAGIWQILKFFDQIPQDRKRKVNQMGQKSPTPGEKSKQYYDTIY